jgi:amidophosphoribosyltransferase
MFDDNCRLDLPAQQHDTIFSDKLGEECGIFGGYCKIGDAAPYVRNGLFKLQHRGQESAGISSGEISQMLHKAKGLVMEVFDENSMMKLTGNFAIGHVRYSTQGGSTSINAQPYLINYFGEDVSIAHNGNIQKAMKMREKFERIGEVFITSSDSEVLLKRIVYGLKKPPKDWSFDEVGKCINKDFSDGSFSVVFCLPNKIFAYRDSYGYRPLMFCDAKEGYFVASEDVAFCGLEINNIIEIQAGWGVEITTEGYEIKQFASKTNEKKCVFEHIYFANPASNIFGANVYESRIELGKILAKNDDVEADIVVPVMESGFVCALGYSRESGIPLEMGLLRNHWVGRSFIQPTKQSRIDKVRAKLTPIKSIIDGKKIILIDDSLVRGTTSTEIIKMLRAAGAKEIHFRLASPMLVNTCCWGVDIPTKEELIANIYNSNEEEIAKYIGADSVKYMPFDGLKEYFGKDGWCYNCFTAKLEFGGTCKQHTKMPALV